MRAAMLIAPLAILLMAASPRGSVAIAFAAPPVATAASDVPCQPPAPATPSPMPSVTEDVPLGVAPTPTPAPDPEATVDPLLAPLTATAAANLQGCWNAGNWHAVTRIVTPHFLETALGISEPDDTARAAALAALDLGVIEIESVGPVAIWSDGRGAVDVFYRRGRRAPVQAVAARWFFIAERGVVRFDEEALLLPPPLGDQVTFGFAIADDVQPLQWASLDGGQVPASPVIALHGANRGREAHTFLLQNSGGETLGVLTLPSFHQGDLVLLDLPPGTYELRDPAVEGSSLELRVMGDE